MLEYFGVRMFYYSNRIFVSNILINVFSSSNLLYIYLSKENGSHVIKTIFSLKLLDTKRDRYLFGINISTKNTCVLIK